MPWDEEGCLLPRLVLYGLEQMRLCPDLGQCNVRAKVVQCGMTHMYFPSDPELELLGWEEEEGAAVMVKSIICHLKNCRLNRSFSS